jgi:uncharacterized membrane protein YhaH (DUF805 family)
MFMPLRRYADFSGRSQRQEYWLFTLFVFMVVVVGLILALVLGGFENSQYGKPAVPTVTLFLLAMIGLFYLAIIIPMLAVTVRRFHDQDYSGWMVLLNFIPYIGGLIVFVFMCMEGTRGPNRFGPDPKGDDGYHAEIFS